MQGDCAVIVTDRDFFQNGIRVEFFGSGNDASARRGSHRPRYRGGDRAALRESVSGGHEVRIGEPFVVERTADLQRDLNAGMALVVRSMEQALAETPDQWVMFQSVWPLEPDGRDA